MTIAWIQTFLCYLNVIKKERDEKYNKSIFFSFSSGRINEVDHKYHTICLLFMNVIYINSGKAMKE